MDPKTCPFIHSVVNDNCLSGRRVCALPLQRSSHAATGAIDAGQRRMNAPPFATETARSGTAAGQPADRILGRLMDGCSSSPRRRSMRCRCRRHRHRRRRALSALVSIPHFHQHQPTTIAASLILRSAHQSVTRRPTPRICFFNSLHSKHTFTTMAAVSPKLSTATTQLSLPGVAFITGGASGLGG